MHCYYCYYTLPSAHRRPERWSSTTALILYSYSVLTLYSPFLSSKVVIYDALSLSVSNAILGRTTAMK
jgi:hypothetical protein